MRANRRRSFRWRLTDGALDLVAQAVWDMHADLVARGLHLMASSGVWRCKDGTHTVRLVYRSDDRAETMTVCIRNVRLAA